MGKFGEREGCHFEGYVFEGKFPTSVDFSFAFLL